MIFKQDFSLNVESGLSARFFGAPYAECLAHCMNVTIYIESAVPCTPLCRLHSQLYDVAIYIEGAVDVDDDDDAVRA